MDEILKNFEQGVKDGIAAAKAKQVDDGGPAFPEIGSRGKAVSGEGMSLWDYFAAHAPEHVTNQDGTVAEARKALGLADDIQYAYDPHYYQLVAMRAAKYADAMLAERKKRFGGQS